MTPNPFLRPRHLAALVTAAGLFLHLSGSATAQRASAVPRSPDAATVAHVLNRIGFGPAPGDVARVRVLGLAAYIDQQLHPERIANEGLTARLAAFETLSMSSSELYESYFGPADQVQREQQRLQRQAPPADPAMTPTPAGENRPQLTPEQQQMQQAARNVPNELMQAKILRAVSSEAQLEEVLVDFWFNHFNVFVGKNQVRQYLTEYERAAIRPYVLGNFRDMLGATAHSPAMLFYLDNFQSQAPQGAATLGAQVDARNRRVGINPPRPGQTRPTPLGNPQRPGLVRPGQPVNPQRPGQPGQVRPRQPVPNQPARPPRGLNENYARELMELHTLGVDGGYKQQDVIEVARVLTGWTIDRPQQGGSFIFRPTMHDAGSKTVLGVSFPSGQGEAEGERLLDMLASHPKTGRHIAFKLAQRFVADEPPAELVDRAAKVFIDTKGDLREVTRTIITSPEFFSDDVRHAKVKTPYEFVVSAMRSTGATVNNAQPLVAALNNLGMPLYGAQPPTGYSMTADAWVNTGALLARMNLAVQLISGTAPLRPADGPRGGAAQIGRAAGPAARQLARNAVRIDLGSLVPDTSDATRQKLINSVLSGEVSAGTRETLARAETPQHLLALMLGSPEFQKR